MRLSVLLLVFTLSALHLFLMGSRLEGTRRRMVAKEDMRRLAVIVMQLFRNGQPPSESKFWEDIGRPPLLDPWKRPYKLKVTKNEKDTVYEWSSAGPDGVPDSADDLRYSVPYGEGVTIDLTRPEYDPMGTRVNDAR